VDLELTHIKNGWENKTPPEKNSRFMLVIAALWEKAVFNLDRCYVGSLEEPLV